MNGIGNIGQAVVRRAFAFGMCVVGADIAEIPEEFIIETGLEVMGKEALLKEADFVSLNCTVDSDSHQIIDCQALLRMKPTVFLINTARGPLSKVPSFKQVCIIPLS